MENFKLPENELVRVIGKCYYFKCYFCGEEVSRYKSSLGKIKYVFCSNKCKHKCGNLYPISEDRKKKLSDMFKGEGNPNYNNRWTDEARENLSIKCKERYKDETYYNKFCEKNRNRVWTEEGKRNIGDSASKRFTGISRPLSDETKLKIGVASKLKWEKEGYKENHRKTMIELGYHRDPKDIPEYEIYFKEADWIESMFNYVTDTKQLLLLKEYGVFNCRSNTKGVVRDHIYGRRHGYANKVPPMLLRHPVNCQLLLIGNNARKAFEGDMGIELEDLYKRILNFKPFWEEQEYCVKYIKSTPWFKEHQKS